MQTRRLAILLLAAALAGCGPGKMTIESGNANGVQINFGDDAAATLPIARQFCMQYERVPRFTGADNHLAYYDCEVR